MCVCVCVWGGGGGGGEGEGKRLAMPLVKIKKGLPALAAGFDMHVPLMNNRHYS